MVSTSHASDTRAETLYKDVPVWLREQILSDRAAGEQWAKAHPKEYEDLANATVQRARNGQTTNKLHAMDCVRRVRGVANTGYTDLHISEAQGQADRQAARGLIILLREQYPSLQGWICPRF